MSMHEPPAPPPPPPGGGYGGPPPGPRYDLGAALSYGWAKFRANVGQVLLAALVVLVGLLVAGAVVGAVYGVLLSGPSIEVDPETGRVVSEGGSGFVVTLLVTALVTALFFVAAQVVLAGFVRGVLGVTEGREFRFQEVLRTDDLGRVLVLALINAAGILVGTVLCYLPGLVYGFVSSFSLYFLIDKGLSPVDSIKASVRLVADNLGSALLWYVVGGIIASAGAFACGVGMLVTVPVVLFGTAYTYKVLTGQQVAA